MTSALSQAHILKHSRAVAAHSFSESSGKHCRVAKKKKKKQMQTAFNVELYFK